MQKKLIDKIKEDIKNWRIIARSGVTPKLPGEGFEKGWGLAINRVCNSIEEIIDGNKNG